MVLKKVTVPPVYWIAGALFSSFYGVHGIRLGIKSLFFSILIIVTILLFSCIKLFRNFYKKKNFTKGVKEVSKKKKKRVLFVLLGFLIGLIGSYRVMLCERQIQTLALLKDVSLIRVTLLEDPRPVGSPSISSFYSVPARISFCTRADGSSFSARGTLTLFIPSLLIQENQSGGIARFAREEEKVVHVYAKGLHMEASGCFSKDAKTFFVDKRQPLFLGWASSFNAIRALFRFNLMYLLYSWGEAGGLLLALVSGNRDFLSLSCIDSFKKAGLFHILALSGMHLSLVAFFAIKLASIFGGKKIISRVTFCTVLFFVWFAGFSPSLSRAFIMFMLLMLGKHLGYPLGSYVNLMAILLASMILHMMISPYDALSLNFMLSYGALIGILIGGSAFFTLLEGWVPPLFLVPLSASLGAQILTAPLLIFTFGLFSPIGLIASPLVSPLVALFLLLGILFIPLGFLFSPSIPVFAYSMQLLYTLILFLAQFFASFPQLVFSSFESTFFFLLFMSSIIFFILYGRYKKMKKRLCIDL